MGKSWSAELATVSVPMGDTPKRVTMVLPFYMNHQFLRRQVQVWSEYPDDLREWLSVIVVDDGSPSPMVESLRNMVSPVALSAYRIEVDVRWNWLAARNIGAHHAPEGWLLMTDMDHVLPVETLDALVYGQHDSDVIYAFSRREHSGESIAPHPNSFFLTREMFWKVGGYDEEISGFYGSDGDIRRRMAATAPMKVLMNHLVRHEYQGDSSTTTYMRKQPEDSAVKKIVAARKLGWTPKVLSFPYSEVAL